MGRETIYEYASNEIDLTKVKQKNGANYDPLEELTDNSGHQPLTIKDTAGQTTTYTYNGHGQVLTITTPPRAGIIENRTTTFDYDEDGYLESVTGPATGATTSYTYDSYGRTRTVTDSDGYTLTYDYDALDRQTKVTYPDTTFEETVYERLDPARTRDRLGRWTHRIYDALRRVTTKTDPLGRMVTQQWCGCGSLEAFIDANGNRTEWERDIQGRVSKETRANDSEWLYAYETTTSRLETVTDPKEQVKTFSYFLDDNLQEVSYANEEHDTPNVTFTYDAAFNRVTTMVDGTGTTTYEYHPAGTSPPMGAGRVATVNGPLSNDTITYGYDELGRVASRIINGVAVTYDFDALGRTKAEMNALGTFTSEYETVTSRLRRVVYPNGQTSTFAYYGNSGDHRLQEIHHRKSDGVTLSKFNYTYDAEENIKTWTQQQDGNPANAYDFEYDRADQLRTAVWRTTDASPTILKRYAYVFDPAGNRTVEQIDNAPVLLAYDIMNRISSQAPGGTMRFAGTLNEAATVTIQSVPANVTSDNKFERGAQVSLGTNQVVVKAKDYAGNERTNTYEVSVSGSSKTFTYDANGNMTGDGTRTFEWDAENRLLAINQGTLRSEFSYDGQSRRVRIVEKSGQTVTSDRRFLWCDKRVCEEGDDTGSFTTKRFYGLGTEESSAKFFYTLDHLGSVREMVDENGTLRARSEFSPTGARTLTGDKDPDMAFTGHMIHSPTGLSLATYRIYDPTLGRWLSEDPIGFAGGVNVYRYGDNNPVANVDLLGLATVTVSPPQYTRYSDWRVLQQVCGPGSYGCAGAVSFDVDCECRNVCGSWYAEIDVRINVEVHYFDNPNSMFSPGLIRQEEEKHVSVIRQRAEWLKGYAENLERIGQPTKERCETMCIGFEANVPWYLYTDPIDYLWGHPPYAPPRYQWWRLFW